MGFVIILSLVLLNSIPNIDMIVLNFRVQETNTSGIVIHHVAGLGRHRLHIICVRMNGQKEPSRHICPRHRTKDAESPRPPFPARGQDPSQHICRKNNVGDSWSVIRHLRNIVKENEKKTIDYLSKVPGIHQIKCRYLKLD